MAQSSRPDSIFARLSDAFRSRGLSVKAVSFALVGVVNTVVDYTVFLLARAGLDHAPGAAAAIGAFGDLCHCGTTETLTLVTANLISWGVAVTGSYVLNSSITFAAESGRKLRWGAYAAFVASGVVGWLANTATLLVAVETLLLPIWLAKAVAILASFVVNFSLSHFVVFRPRRAAGKLDENI